MESLSLRPRGRSRPGRSTAAAIATLATAFLAAGAVSCADESRFDPPEPIAVRAVGRFNVHGGAHEDPRLSAVELSGLAWLGAERYVAVGDQHATLHFLSIHVDRATGAVTSIAFDEARPLTTGAGARLETIEGGPDREGVAFDPASGSFWIADERTGGADAAGPSLHRHGTGGRRLEVVVPADHPALAPLSSARANLGLESLARRPGDGGYWTATEEALEIDGPTAGPDAGTVVRLVSFDASMRPLAQYAYRTDPVSGVIASPIPAVGHELSGVVALAALPGGGLLALERALGGDESGMAGFRIRIYEVDVTDATDVSGMPYRDGLQGTRYEPVSKRRLAELRFGLVNSNFEGMALGPRLENGDRSLLLIADNGGGDRQSVYALRVAGIGGR